MKRVNESVVLHHVTKEKLCSLELSIQSWKKDHVSCDWRL